MNTHQHPQHSDQQHIDERRWQAQEKARRGDVDADPVELRIAQALRHAPAVHLPADFAARLAAQVQAQAATVLPANAGMIRRCQRRRRFARGAPRQRGDDPVPVDGPTGPMLCSPPTRG